MWHKTWSPRITNRLSQIAWIALYQSSPCLLIALRLIYDSAPQTLPQADSLGAEQSSQAQPVTAKPARKGRITIHQPRIDKEERHGSNVLSQTNVADSTRSNSQSHTSTNNSKEVIGGAEPPALTAVFIVLGLGITLLLIGAVFGYLWLHKKHII